MLNARTFVHAAAVGFGLLLAACDQPAPKCNVAHGAFWAQYTLVSGEGDCAMLTGEELDVQSYYAPRSARDPRPDYDRVSIAIQPLTITVALANAAGIADPEPDDTPYALGPFATRTARKDGFCVADTLEPARLRLAEVPAHAVDMCTTAPDAPAYDLTYAFSNVRVYYTPAAIGTQFSADLTYTQGDCVATYKVTALYPMVSCAASGAVIDAGPAGDEDAGAPADAGEMLDAGGSDASASDADAACPPPEPETAAPTPDDSLCENAGINPDFAVACDPAALMCVLAKDAPSLR